MHRESRHQRALSLAETLLASIILAATVAAVSQAIVAGQMETHDGLHRRHGVELCEALMEEILRLPYEDPNGASNPGPESGESDRTEFDNIDDFHGFSESAGNITDAAGEAYADEWAVLQTFNRSVTVAAGNQTVTGFADAVSGLLITVTTTDEGGSSWVVKHFVPEPQTGGG